MNQQLHIRFRPQRGKETLYIMKWVLFLKIFFICFINIMMDQMRKFHCNVQQNIDFYYVLFIFNLYFFLFKSPTALVKCDAWSDVPRSWHPCRDTSLCDNKELMLAGPSAWNTNTRNYMKQKSRTKERPTLKYREIKSTLQDPGQGANTKSGANFQSEGTTGNI